MTTSRKIRSKGTDPPKNGSRAGNTAPRSKNAVHTNHTTITEVFEMFKLLFGVDLLSEEAPAIDGLVEICRSRPINGRRKKKHIQALQDAIRIILRTEHPMTVRQLFYRLVSHGVIHKTEAEYKTVVRLLGRMRRENVVPFMWITDFTRWMRKPTTYSGLKQCLKQTSKLYRRDLWADQNDYVEIWLEKDALAGVVYDETEIWAVPLMVTRGYPSLSFLHSAAETIGGVNRPTVLYYFGDHDPSGVDISRKVEADIRVFAPNLELHFERVAVNPEQIKKWNLPTRPTKCSDSRSKSFSGESVEVDAIPPSQLRTLVRECIERHINQDVLARTKLIEEQERQSLEDLAVFGVGEGEDANE